MRSRLAISGFLLIIFWSCANRQPPVAPAPANTPPETKIEFTLASNAFKEGEAIPRQYTCDGVNVSPPLEWSGVPRTAKTVAIIAEDTDAPARTWVHWVLYNLRLGSMV